MSLDFPEIGREEELCNMIKVKEYFNFVVIELLLPLSDTKVMYEFCTTLFCSFGKTLLRGNKYVPYKDVYVFFRHVNSDVYGLIVFELSDSV